MNLMVCLSLQEFMSQQLTMPMFPLPIVVFEGEELRLHIFESRYKKLIRMCANENAGFGIPFFYNNKLEGSGAIVFVEKIENMYENGEMDIVCRAKERFEIVDFIPSKTNDNAAMGIISLCKYVNNEDKELNFRLTDLLKELLSANGMETPVAVQDFTRWIHKCGLSADKELELACLDNAYERQLYLIEHLKNLLLSQQQLQQMLKMVQLNGHFKKITQSF